MGNFFNKAPEIIREAAKSPLGVVSLVIILISLLALSFFTTASESVRVGIFILVFVGASLFIGNLLRYAKLEKSDVLSTTRQLSTSDSNSLTSETQLLQGSKNITTTCMQDGMAYFLLTEKGEFIGDIGALRRVAVGVLNSGWDGQIKVHHALLEKLQREANDLLKEPTLTTEQAQTVEYLQSQAAGMEYRIEIASLAIKQTFTSILGRESTWGVPMDTERAVGFLTGVFATMGLISMSSNYSVPCQLYVPRRVDDPISSDILLSEDEIKNIQESWDDELREYDYASKVLLSWGWPTLVPLWKFSDEFIATRLLPRIVVKLVNTIVARHPKTVVKAWEQLNQRFPISSNRNALVPYHWCLALKSDRFTKDLAWLNSPPQMRSQIAEVLPRRRS